MSRHARSLQPLDAVDLEVVRLYLRATETQLGHIQGQVAELRRTVEQIQGRNPARTLEGFK